MPISGDASSIVVQSNRDLENVCDSKLIEVTIAVASAIASEDVVES